MPGLHIGSGRRAVAIDIDQDAADEMLRAAAAVEEAAHVGGERRHAVLVAAGAIVEADVLRENVAQAVPLLVVEDAGEAGQAAYDFPLVQ